METINEIVREMRERTAKSKDEAWYDQARWAELCDRIEAAAKREARSGNAAKMCEVLESASERLRKATESEYFGEDVLYLVGCMRSVAKACDDALIAPARNCDRHYQNAHDVFRYFRDETGRKLFRTSDLIDWLLFDDAKGEAK